jgi:O-antigen biosynthesis alpha-1,3-mannosyltransferase
MKIAFDLSNLRSRDQTGVGVYTINLIKALQKKGIDCIGSYNFKYKKDVAIIKEHIDLELIPFIPIISTFTFPQIDIFHGPSYKVPYTRKFKKVLTIHDFVRYQKQLERSDFSTKGDTSLNYRLYKCKPNHVITVSKFIQNELERYYPTFANKSTAIYNGIDHHKIDSQNLVKNPKFSFPFLLYIGLLDRKKNIVNLIEAFERIALSYPTLNLVLVGKPGFDYQMIVQKIKNSLFAGRIILTGFLSDAEVVGLYQQAEIFVFPSLYEGFGIPILEAMRLNCPVITSNFGAMAEIGAEASVLCDTRNPIDLAQNIQNLLNSPELRNTMIEKGKIHWQKFTWETCAKETIKVYEKVLS